LGKRIDALIDTGVSGIEPTTVIDLTASEPRVVRLGLGQADLGSR
jgi:tRNA A37 threonylcarbamoyladenosine synthetase subunit TsaC/SUA5/YrdC